MANLVEIEHLAVSVALRIAEAFVLVVGVVPAAGVGVGVAIDTGVGGGKFHLPTDLNAVALNTTAVGDAHADRAQRENAIGVIDVKPLSPVTVTARP